MTTKELRAKGTKVKTNKKLQRYCLKQDEDCHWYLVPTNLAKTFLLLCDEAYTKESFDKFNKAFEKMRIDGPGTITFLEPK